MIQRALQGAAGIIAEFTGVSSPYERPEPGLSLDTGHVHQRLRCGSARLLGARLSTRLADYSCPVRALNVQDLFHLTAIRGVHLTERTTWRMTLTSKPAPLASEKTSASSEEPSFLLLALDPFDDCSQAITCHTAYVRH